MRTLVTLTGLAAFLAAIAPPSALAQDWKIGFITPTTGPATTVGTRQLATVRWWEQEVNAGKGIKGRKVQVVHCNDEGNPAKAVTCARDLLAQGVVLLINGSVSGAIRAVVPLVKNGPVMLTPAPGIMPEPSSYVFQTSPADAGLTTAVAEYAKANRVGQLGIIAATDTSGELGAASAAAVFPEYGVKYALARIDLRATDATTQLARVAGPGAALIYSTYTGAGAATVVKSYANLGLTQPLIVSYANISDPFVALIKDDMPKRLLGVALKGVVPELLTDPAERQRSSYFIKSYEQARGGERADMINMIALGMVDVAESVLRNVADPANADEVKRYLESTPVKSFQTIRFSPHSHIGMGPSDVVVVELKGSRWVKADPLK
ncbi:ABC transporter substrate-binding protein [Variovorax terrae]|uniref:ABC transporter substrate-binding protein n=1 Tax=Variovorax terrae TaxID=2923278 RepID=A0A9X1VX92_9BURK|nr:ABC transporter substrate-binding protein [Variovorax terrae]MCJ0764905.1 ABC transporter substrate-binding protein [Variovorax terrae]